MNTADTIASVHEPSARSDAAYALLVDTSSVASEAGESSREWRPAPGEFVSLWDMLRIHASELVLLDASLQRMRANLEQMADLEQSINELDEESVARELKPNVVDQKNRLAIARAEILNSTKESVESLVRYCTSLELSVSLIQAERLRDKSEPTADFSELSAGIREFELRVQDELQARMFWFVPPKREKYGLEEYPFGRPVADKFPRQAEDIAEASKCMCFGRYTAAVFHLMRVMEASLVRMAKALKLSINLNRPWGPVLGDIDAAIAALPGAPGSHPAGTGKEKTRHARFAEAAAYLHHVKDAWRNTTMHPKRTYTEEEAVHLFDNVRVFMQTLAKLR